MPANEPLVGETWETTDAATGRAAQAAVTETNPQMIRLVARHGRILTMPRRSFLMTWHFIQEAPAQTCAHGDCDEPAYLQVNDLGNWVWICPKHLPAHVQPLLPTDTPGAILDHCPVCRSADSEPWEAGPHEVNRCGACGTYWTTLMGEGDGSPEERFEDGLRFGEHLQDLASHLESEGLAVRGLIGPPAWDSLQSTVNLQVHSTHEDEDGNVTRTRQADTHHFAGVKLDPEASLGNSLVLLGERPRTGVQRLGGQPSNDDPAPEALPEVGSYWTNGRGHLQVDSVGLSDQTSRGRQLTVTGTTQDDMEASTRLPLVEFLRTYQLDASFDPARAHDTPDLPKTGSIWWETRTFRKVHVQQVSFIQGQHVVHFAQGSGMALEDFRKAYSVEPPEPPCKIDEVWESKSASTETPFKIEKLLDNKALVRRADDNTLREMPFYILATRYKKSSRRTALERLMGD